MTIECKKIFVPLILAVCASLSFDLQAREPKEVRRQQANKVRQIIQFNTLAVERFILATENQKIKDQALYSYAVTKAEAAKQSYLDIQGKLFATKAQKINAAMDMFVASIKHVSSHDKAMEAYVEAEKLLILTFKPPLEPSQTPDRDLGEKTYQAYCSACHGIEGDMSKSLSRKLKPPPIDFHHTMFKKVGSPARFFLSVLLGIPNTSMDGFREKLTDHEIWSTLFWIMTLDYKNKKNVSDCPKPPGLNFALLSQLSDEELGKWLKNTEQVACARLNWAFDKSVPRK
jgi:mono/diheme cytochrome c family protein